MKQRIKTAAVVTAMVLLPAGLTTAAILAGWMHVASGVMSGAVTAYVIAGCAVLLVREARKALRDTGSEEAKR